MERIGWDDYFMEIANIALKRATCLRRQCGAVLVRDNHIIATGYNGAPSGVEHCKKTGCLREQLKIPSGQRLEICRAAHAEENTIVQAALNGINTAGATLYTSFSPCTHCAKMIINAKIKRVVCSGSYPDELGTKLLKEAGVQLDIIKNLKLG